eukprot:8755842-Pyramimonas_sp.AAC.1
MARPQGAAAETKQGAQARASPPCALTTRARGPRQPTGQPRRRTPAGEGVEEKGRCPRELRNLSHMLTTPGYGSLSPASAIQDRGV